MDPGKPDIAFAMTGDVHRNARALRQLAALSEAGFRTSVFCLPATDVTSVLPDAVDVREVAVTAGGGPRYFRSVHRAMSAALRRADARLYHASDLYVLPAVRRAADSRERPYTFDSRELYTHVAAVEGRPAVRLFWRLLEGRHIRDASHVWTVSDSIADHLADRYGIARPSVQHNAPVLPSVGPDAGILRTRAGIDGSTPLVVHLGQMRKDRGGSVLVRAAAALERLHLAFLGYGPEQSHLQTLAERLGVEGRVHFLRPVPPGGIHAAIADADAGVTLLEDTCLNHRYALPNKLFDYMASGLPVLASDLPESRRMVRTYDFGVTADPTSVESVTAALTDLIADGEHQARWRRNARAAAETFDWRSASHTFISQIQRLVGHPAPRKHA